MKANGGVSNAATKYTKGNQTMFNLFKKTATSTTDESSADALAAAAQRCAIGAQNLAQAFAASIATDRYVHGGEFTQADITLIASVMTDDSQRNAFVAQATARLATRAAAVAALDAEIAALERETATYRRERDAHQNA